jgi:glycosyltransferase involved in cell wall biosynthesis
VTDKSWRRPKLRIVDAPTGAPRVMVVGAGWRFTSGISYYTCRLTNALAEVAPTSALLMRQLVPTFLYPGRNRVGEQVNDLSYGPSVQVFDGVDWFWGTSMGKARKFMQETRPQVLVLQWWTGAVLHSYLQLVRLARKSGCKVIIEWHEVQDTGEARIPGVARYVTKAMKMLLRRVDGHVVHSQYDLDLLRRTYFLPDELVTIAPHGPYDHHKQEVVSSGPASDPTLTVPVEPEDFVFLYFRRRCAITAVSCWSARPGRAGPLRWKRWPPARTAIASRSSTGTSPTPRWPATSPLPTRSCCRTVAPRPPARCTSR